MSINAMYYFGRRQALGSLLIVGLALASLSTFGMAPAASAQERDASGHPIVGSWVVAVTVDGQPPLELPNLATFTSDGTMIVAAPPRLPELPGSDAARDLFSSGHGVWSEAGAGKAAFTFAFLVSGPQGALASVNTVNGNLELDQDGEAYRGSFTLEIADPGGRLMNSASGSFRARRIDAGTKGVISIPEATAR